MLRSIIVIGLAILSAIATVIVGKSRSDFAASTVSARDVGESAEAKTELVVAVIVSSTCGAARTRAFADAIRTIRQELQSIATATGQRFAVIGVSVDRAPAVGWKFLRRFGRFDQVVTGGSWDNIASVLWIVRDFPGPLTLPQVVVLERSVPGTDEPGGADRLVTRRVGRDQIADFADHLAQLNG